MTKYRLLTTLTLISFMAACLVATPRSKQNILSVKQNINDNDIVFPESFDTNTHQMMTNWYLQNYAVLDADVESREPHVASDEVYIKRLAAMPTVIEMPYNQIVRKYIERYITRNRTLVEEMLGMSLYYMPIFEQALEKEGLPLELKYLPVVESALDPNAVSRVGAAGLWQFMVGTGKGLGLEINSLVDERRDPYRSSEMAARYLKNLYQIYNDWSLAIAAYNCGPGNVNKALHRNGGTGDFWEIYNYLPRETRGYVPAFIAANYVMTYYKQHNISPSLARKPLITDTVSVNRRIHFSQIAQVLNMPVEEIRVFNPQFRQDVIPGDNHPYMLVLPSQQVYSFIMSEDSITNFRNDLYAQRKVVEPGQLANADDYYLYEGDDVQEVQANEDEEASAQRSEQQEREQIAEVQQIEREAAKSPYKGSYRVDVDDHGKDKVVAKSSAKRNEQTTRNAKSDSQQWKSRNAQYVENATSNLKRESKETTYKKSKSSKSTSKTSRKKTTAKEKKPAQPTEVTVQKGESLTKIAEKTGVSVSDLKKANNIDDGNKIKAGEKIKIPTKDDKTTTTKKSSKSTKSATATKSNKSTKKSKSTTTKKKKSRKK